MDVVGGVVVWNVAANMLKPWVTIEFWDELGEMAKNFAWLCHYFRDNIVRYTGK
jgi:hypothetical protein